jgi:hypothetical protein
MKIRKVIMRSQQRALSVSFSHWCDLVRDKRRHGYIAASTLRRIQIRVLVKAFNKWYEFAQHEKRRHYVLHKVFTRLQNEQLAQSFQRWREFAAESYDAKVKLRKIVSRMLRLRLSQGFNMWREKTEEFESSLACAIDASRPAFTPGSNPWRRESRLKRLTPTETDSSVTFAGASIVQRFARLSSVGGPSSKSARCTAS